MFRRLVLTTLAIVALLSVPSQAGHTRAASIPLCSTTAAVARAVVLPMQSVGSQPIRGMFCFAPQYTPNTGHMLPYEARIAGLVPARPAVLRVVAALIPTGRDASQLDIIAYVYQPAVLLQAVAHCGCIQPAGPAPHPNTVYRGAQVMRMLPNARGVTDFSGTMDLVPVSVGAR